MVLQACYFMLTFLPFCAFASMHIEEFKQVSLLLTLTFHILVRKDVLPKKIEHLFLLSYLKQIHSNFLALIFEVTLFTLGGKNTRACQKHHRSCQVCKCAGKASAGKSRKHRCSHAAGGNLQCISCICNQPGHTLFFNTYHKLTIFLVIKSNHFFQQGICFHHYIVEGNALFWTAGVERMKP